MAGRFPMVTSPHAASFPPPLFFSCGTCGNALEAPATCAGMEAPCPLCGAPVRAPAPPPDPTELFLDPSFWDDPEPEPPARLVSPPPAVHSPPPRSAAESFASEPIPFPSLPPSWFPPAAPAPAPAVESGPAVPAPLRFPSRALPSPELTNLAIPASIPSRPISAADTLPIPTPTGPDAEEPDVEEAEDGSSASAHDPARVRARRRARRRLRFMDAGLLLLFFGVAAMAGAAIIFKEGNDKSQPPVNPPTLTAAHFELMRDVEERRSQSMEDARQIIQLLLAAPDAASAEQVMLPGRDPDLRLPFPVFPGSEPRDFEFISGERLPGTERFLSLFEVAGAAPVMLMVEETAAGSRIHGAALDQQLNHRLETLLARPGEGEGVFYLRIRPTPAPQTADFDQKRADLADWVKVDAESAFPMEGPSAFLACIAPGSPALDVLERRLHDPGFRPAVARLAWRQHRESGPFLELVEFLPNSWSRH